VTAAGTTAPAPAAAALRDPALPRRLGWLVVGLVVAWPLLVAADFAPWRLVDGSTWPVLAGFVGAFFPPSTDPEFLRLLGRATLETLAIATAGLFLAFCLAAPLAVLATRALSLGRAHAGVRGAVRLLLTLLRAVPEVVWALVFVRALGLGPGAGVLALAVTYGGMLGKVYAEILESADARPVRALLEAGGPRLAVLCYAGLPQSAQELASYTVYRWECAVRASVVMGFVGAGGLGQLMDQSMKMLAGGEASAVLLVFLALVAVADAISAFVRRILA
jgi:phosphonate transport system permease protein